MAGTRWTLLTGATGFLGRELLLRFLATSYRVAVLVRDAADESATSRIDSALTEMEDRIKRRLPRPVVLVGDICDRNLGMAHSDASWFARNVDRIVNCAASLSFVNRPDGEPFRTNVHGMQNLIDVASSGSVKEFHQISTAYVCGATGGIALERLTDAGVDFRNPYEESKAAAERMLANAGDHFCWSIYRPSIIVGHPDDGFTTAYHTIYSVLRVIASIPFERLTEDRAQIEPLLKELMRQLGLHQTESKNLVPVDWVADSIVALAQRADRSKRIFHLTNDQPVDLKQLLLEMLAAILSHRSRSNGRSITRLNSSAVVLNEMSQEIHQQLAAYLSYFATDPKFDRELKIPFPDWRSCPQMTSEVFQKIFGFALEQDFGQKRFALRKMQLAGPTSIVDFRRFLGVSLGQNDVPSAEGYAPNRIEPSAVVFRLIASGPGGTTVDFVASGDQWTVCSPAGIVPRVEVRTTTEVLAGIVAGRSTVSNEVVSGRVVLHGDGASDSQTLRKIGKLVQNLRPQNEAVRNGSY